jgi:ubiquinone/menaquinone biosynthesis C-methylase UbiE/uncharacterized protein YbaR (Trm112 family)
VLREDVELLRSPGDGGVLTLTRVDQEDADGEVLEGELQSQSGRTFPIRNGIPRFVDDPGDNSTWEYKWTAIDRGRGLNYRIIDKSDPAYEVHDLFDRNDHDGTAHASARGGVALDIGCGVGQYSVRLAREFEPRKLVALDLTKGVDVFRKIMLERYPELKSRILIVQGSALDMPFAEDTFDYAMSLGVLMHSGHTLDAIRQSSRVVKDGGRLNIWIYASEPVPYEAAEPGREGIRAPFGFVKTQLNYTVVWLWIRLFRRIPHAWTVRILKWFSSDTWYRLTTTKGPDRIAPLIFGSVVHPDPDYRFINNYDGYVNTWSDTWNEHEIIPVLHGEDLVPIGLSDWRLGVLAEKRRGFFNGHVRN